MIPVDTREQSSKIKESNTTGAVGGFQTLKAFVRKKDNKDEQVK